MGWSGTDGWVNSVSRGLRAVQEADEAAEQIDWVQQVRDLGPLVWLVALAAAAVWFLVLGLAAAKARPRRVAPGPAPLDLPGDEPPALVNLVANSWSLGHEAVAATLLDLAARMHISVQNRGDGSLSVHVPAEGRADEDQLTPYERQVLSHVRDLASTTRSRIVPAGALTTGNGREASHWWSHFRGSVIRDATDRGLARKRWSKRLYLLLFLTGVPVAVPWGVALATAVYDNGTDGELANGAVAYGVLGLFFPLIVIGVIAARRQVADTEAGREAAARWLGLRTRLGTDPLFTETDASGVGLWGRQLAYGAALGLAHGAVTSVPLGAEDRREIWSTTSGTWRVVRVRYSWPGMFAGRHPAWTIAGGLLMMVMLIMPYQLYQLGLYEDGSPALLMPLLLMVLPAFWGGVNVLRGLADALAGRRTVVGEVLRIEEVGSTKSPAWHVVVDDGTSDQIDAWRVRRRPRVGEGARVQGEVSRWLRHVRRPQIIGYADGSLPEPGDNQDFLTIGVRGSGTSIGDVGPGSLHLDVSMALNHHSHGAGPGVLPDAEALSRAVGRVLRVDSTFASNPAVASGESAAGFHLDAGRLQIVLLGADAMRTYTRLRFLHRAVEGIGEEAIRLRASGTLLVRQGQDTVMVAVDAPDERGEEVERIQVAAAHAALSAVPGGQGRG